MRQDFFKDDFILTWETLPAIKQMTEYLPGGFVLYQENENRDIILVNQDLLKIYECDTLEEFKELTGYSFNGMVYEEDRARVQASIDSQIQGEHGGHDHVEYRILTRSQTIRWVDDYGHFSHSEVFGDVYYVFLADITEKLLAQEEKTTFFFNLSHEILTPMNAVSTFVKLAREKRNQPELLDAYLKQADEAVDHMVSVIDHLVEINREGGWDAVFVQTNTEKGQGKLMERRNDSIRILIVDDNEINRCLLLALLEDAGFQVELAEDGAEAVELIRSHDTGFFDVVLMDIQMDRMDGYEAARQIRQLPQGQTNLLSILALSANAREEDKTASRQSGMDGHLAKPYNREHILSAIYRCMQMTAYERAAEQDG